MPLLITNDSNDRSNADLLTSDSRLVGITPSGRQTSVAFAAGGGTAGQTLGSQKRPSCLDQFEWDSAQQGSFEFLEKENARLRDLVVRLSETIIRRVVDRK
jgi:hypothetical protein